jgi:GNAT superfamily N-acetyltransferase
VCSAEIFSPELNTSINGAILQDNTNANLPAFLTSLSANLRIDPDLPSPLGTPNFRGGNPSGFPLPPPSPLSFSTVSNTYNPHPSPAADDIMSTPSTQIAPKAPIDDIPKLTYFTAETEDDRVEALRLVADSVAQQRQSASRTLIFHPINLAIYFLVIGILAQYMWKAKEDLLLFGTTIGGVTMIGLAAVRMAVGGYLALAEGINWEWLGDDRLIVVKWGEEVIGALVLGWADNSEGARKRGTRRRRGKALVRAWTVKLKYRGKGVGEGLLEEAVKIAGERGADGIVFDADHASKFCRVPSIYCCLEYLLITRTDSKRILPRVYNGYLNKQEARAEKALEKVADEKGNFRQRRSSPTWGSR